MRETNGQLRFDRIEAILERHSTMIVSIDASIERQIAANEAAHDRFEAEHQRLLTAQILMNGAMQKMADGMTSLEIKMQEATEKLNALIVTVDGIVHKRPDPF